MEENNKKTIREIVEALNVIDDALFRKMAEDLEFCEEVIIFISRFDVFGQGKTTYHIDRVIRETGSVAENGFTEIYVNAAVDDGSRIAKLMEIFTDLESYDYEQFPKTSQTKARYKKGEGGTEVMCELVEDYAKDYAKEYAEEYAKEETLRADKAETRADEAEKENARETVNVVENCSRNLSVTLEEACRILGMEKEKYDKAKASL